MRTVPKGWDPHARWLTSEAAASVVMELAAMRGVRIARPSAVRSLRRWRERGWVAPVATSGPGGRVPLWREADILKAEARSRASERRRAARARALAALPRPRTPVPSEHGSWGADTPSRPRGA